MNQDPISDHIASGAELFDPSSQRRLSVDAELLRLLTCDSHLDCEAIKAANGVADKIGLHCLDGEPECALMRPAAVCARADRVDRRDIGRMLKDKAEVVAR